MAELASRIAIGYRMPEADLETLVRCYRDWITHSGKPGRQAEVLARELTKEFTDEVDKAHAIQQWVKNHLNIHDPDELSNISPHWHTPRLDLEKVLKDRSATCEQAASLMWSMLKSLNIDADVVLTTGRGDPPIDESMHDLTQFTHVFLALENGTLLDTTSRLLPFGLLSWKYQGREAVYATKDGYEKRCLPASSADDNNTTIVASVSIDVGGSAQAEAQFAFTGQNAYSIRRRLFGMTTSQQQGWLHGLVGRTAGRVEIQEAAIKHLREPDRSLEISTRFRHNLKKKETDSGLLVGLAPFFELMGRPRFLKDTRVNPIWFRHRKSTNLKVLFTLPADYRLIETPQNVSLPDKNQSSAFQFKVSFRKVQENLLEMSCVLRINQFRIPVEDYPQLRSMVSRFLELSNSWILLRGRGKNK